MPRAQRNQRGWDASFWTYEVVIALMVIAVLAAAVLGPIGRAGGWWAPGGGPPPIPQIDTRALPPNPAIGSGTDLSPDASVGMSRKMEGEG